MEPRPIPKQTADLDELTLQAFAQHLRGSGHPRRLIELARDEDLGDPMRDWTGELMLAVDDTRRALLRSRESGIVSGLAFVDDLIELFGARDLIEHELAAADGDAIEPGSVLAEFSGNARAIVALERTMLNLISRMSGVATLTARFVALVEGTGAQICDTRKTTPGLRAFEKYAVRCAGGTTHRMGLFDAVLVKDNHLAGLSPDEVAAAIRRISGAIRGQDTRPGFVQVEVDSIEQLRSVLDADAGDGTGIDDTGIVDIVLLDNMSVDELAQAVGVRDRSGHRARLEASGGVNERTVGAIARTGVERISIGALTHQARSLDLGLDAIG